MPVDYWGMYEYCNSIEKTTDRLHKKRERERVKNKASIPVFFQRFIPPLLLFFAVLLCCYFQKRVSVGDSGWVGSG